MNVSQIPSIKVSRHGVPYINMFLGSREGDRMDEIDAFPVRIPMPLPFTDEMGENEQNRTITDEGEIADWAEQRGFEDWAVIEVPLCDVAPGAEDISDTRPVDLLPATTVELDKREAALAWATVSGTLGNLKSWLEQQPTTADCSKVVEEMGNLNVLAAKLLAFASRQGV